MVKAKFWAVLCLLLPLMACAEDYKEGKDYTVVSQVATSKPEVREFFSVLCSHCYHFESAVGELKAQLPENVAFERTHVPFVGREVSPFYMRAFAVAQTIGQEQKLVAAMFKMAHVEKRFFQSEADVRAFFISEGVAAEKYDSIAPSFAVEGMISEMASQTADKKIMGVPAFLVNGKYLVRNESLKSYDDLIKLVNYLVTKS